MGNPRRDAIEYGVLIGLTSSMAIAYGLLIAYTQQRDADGKRRRLPRVNLDESVNLGEVWDEMRNNFGPGGGISSRGGGMGVDRGGSDDVATSSRDRGGREDRPPAR
jgi:hypothetical protein